MDPVVRQHESTGGHPHEVSATSTPYTLVGSCLHSPMQKRFSDLICQPLVASYVIDAYLCLAILHVWALEYQHNVALRLMVDTKAESQLPAGEDNRATLATFGSTKFRRMPTLYCNLCYGSLRSPGITEGRNSPLGLRDDDDDDDDDDDYDGDYEV